MAKTTYTTSQATEGAPVTLHHEAETVKRVRWEGSSLSLSDEILIAKFPNNVIITDIYGVGGCQASDIVFKLGLKSGSQTAFGTHTLSSTTNPVKFSMLDDNIAPQHLSLSDDATPQYTYLYVTASSGSWTQTVSLDFVIRYHRP